MNIQQGYRGNSSHGSQEYHAESNRELSKGGTGNKGTPNPEGLQERCKPAICDGKRNWSDNIPSKMDVGRYYEDPIRKVIFTLQFIQIGNHGVKADPHTFQSYNNGGMFEIRSVEAAIYQSGKCTLVWRGNAGQDESQLRTGCRVLDHSLRFRIRPKKIRNVEPKTIRYPRGYLDCEREGRENSSGPNHAILTFNIGILGTYQTRNDKKTPKKVSNVESTPRIDHPSRSEGIIGALSTRFDNLHCKEDRESDGDQAFSPRFEKILRERDISSNGGFTSGNRLLRHKQLDMTREYIGVDLDMARSAMLVRESKTPLTAPKTDWPVESHG